MDENRKPPSPKIRFMADVLTTITVAKLDQSFERFYHSQDVQRSLCYMQTIDDVKRMLHVFWNEGACECNKITEEVVAQIKRGSK